MTSEPRRLLDEDEDRFELRLLRSALQDEPPPGAASRAAIALGLGAGTATVASTAQGAPPIAKVAAAALVKWFGVGVLSGAVVTGSLCYGTAPPISASRVTPVAPAPLRNSAKAVPHGRADDVPLVPVPDRPAEAQTPRAVQSQKPREASPAMAPAMMNSRKPAPAALEDGPGRGAVLSVELSILESARHALVQHDPAGVLHELDVYSSAPRTGVLDTEARMLRIEALLQQGDRTRAVELARSFLAANPSSPHAARLRQVIDSR